MVLATRTYPDRVFGEALLGTAEYLASCVLTDVTPMSQRYPTRAVFGDFFREGIVSRSACTHRSVLAIR